MRFEKTLAVTSMALTIGHCCAMVSIDCRVGDANPRASCEVISVQKVTTTKEERGQRAFSC